MRTKVGSLFIKPTVCPVRYRVFEESVLFRSELARFRIQFMKMVRTYLTYTRWGSISGAKNAENEL